MFWSPGCAVIILREFSQHLADGFVGAALSIRAIGDLDGVASSFLLDVVQIGTDSGSCEDGESTAVFRILGGESESYGRFDNSGEWGRPGMACA